MVSIVKLLFKGKRVWVSAALMVIQALEDNYYQCEFSPKQAHTLSDGSVTLMNDAT